MRRIADIRNIIIMLLAISLVAGSAYAKSTISKGKDKGLPPGLHKKADKGIYLRAGRKNCLQEIFLINQYIQEEELSCRWEEMEQYQ